MISPVMSEIIASTGNDDNIIDAEIIEYKNGAPAEIEKKMHTNFGASGLYFASLLRKTRQKTAKASKYKPYNMSNTCSPTP